MEISFEYNESSLAAKAARALMAASEEMEITIKVVDVVYIDSDPVFEGVEFKFEKGKWSTKIDGLKYNINQFNLGDEIFVVINK